MTSVTLRAPVAEQTSRLVPARRRGPEPFGHLGSRAVRAVPGGPLVNGPAVVLARWAAVLLGAVVTARSGGLLALTWGVPLVAIAGVRTLEVRYVFAERRAAVWASLVAELAVTGTVVAATGGARSGWSVVLVVEAALAGCVLPSRLAGAAASTGVIGLVAFNLAGGAFRDAAHWVDPAALLVAIALATAYASWVVRHVEWDRVVLAAENDRLMATNDLLVTLEHAVLRSDGLSDPQQAARAVASLVQELLEPEVVVVAAAGAVPGTWRILLSEGVSLTPVVDRLEAVSQLPDRGGDGVPVRLDARGPWLSHGSRSGLCAPLLVRDRLIGAMILEHGERRRWDDRDVAALKEVATWAGLLVDNACRFNALWVAGAADERARIARDLHDHLGQSIAALGLELDGIARQLDDPTAAGVRDLRNRVSAMVAELRFTMRELCSDVSVERDLETALDDLVTQLNRRFATSISLAASTAGRLPLTQEHQLLLMARRALTGVLQAQADHVLVSLACDASKGRLEIDYADGEVAPGGLYEVPGSPIVDALAELKLLCDGVGAHLDYEARDDGRCTISCRVLP